MNKSDLIAIRNVEQGDVAFVFNTWLKGLYYGGDAFFRKIPKAIFMDGYHKVIERILQSPGVIVKVACLKDDPEVITGYAVYRQAGGVTVIDWAYVKKEWRGIGLSKDLLPPEAYAATHLTRAGEAILTKLYPKTIFNPLI